MARLRILESTLKKLFSLAQNRCAFPDCTQEIYDGNGTLYADVCHIEAANEDGERFNREMCDQQRRDFSNLIILCEKHHTATNNVTEYTVGVMKRMKASHEAKIRSVEQPIDELLFKKLLVDLEKKSQINVTHGGVQNVIQHQTNNYYNRDTKSEDQRRLGIISELFEHILASHTVGDEKDLLENSERLPNTSDKIHLNFPANQHPAVRRMLINTVHYRTLVETFLRSKSLTQRGNVLALREIVQKNFCDKLKVYDADTVIGDIEILENVKGDLLPTEKTIIPEYEAASIAIVLHFFEICDIGKRTVNENSASEDGGIS